jgi:hypothetical protein
MTMGRKEGKKGGAEASKKGRKGGRKGGRKRRNEGRKAERQKGRNEGRREGRPFAVFRPGFGRPYSEVRTQVPVFRRIRPELRSKKWGWGRTEDRGRKMKNEE